MSRLPKKQLFKSIYKPLGLLFLIALLGLTASCYTEEAKVDVSPSIKPNQSNYDPTRGSDDAATDTVSSMPCSRESCPPAAFQLAIGGIQAIEGSKSGWIVGRENGFPNYKVKFAKTTAPDRYFIMFSYPGDIPVGTEFYRLGTNNTYQIKGKPHPSTPDETTFTIRIRDVDRCKMLYEDPEECLDQTVTHLKAYEQEFVWYLKLVGYAYKPPESALDIVKCSAGVVGEGLDSSIGENIPDWLKGVINGATAGISSFSDYDCPK